jgi:hypothetical protein
MCEIFITSDGFESCDFSSAVEHQITIGGSISAIETFDDEMNAYV